MSNMSNRQSLFEIEWWVISKRSIYLIIALLLCGVLVGALSVYLWIYGNPFEKETKLQAPTGARFVSFDGDVRVVRAQTRETVQVNANTQLYPGDIVQTQADGRARILLADGSTLLVRPNSVVTIRDSRTADGGQQTHVRVAVERGQINVRTEEQSEKTSNIVETRLTESRLAAQTGASFGVRDDNTEDIRVSAGSIETTTRGGEKTVVRAGEYVAINQTGNIARRERLLDVPAPLAPRDLERIFARSSGTNVTLRWQKPATGTPAYYRIEVATSPFFVSAGKVIERDQLTNTEYNVGELRPGVYYWRVRAVAPSGQASEWSEPQKFTIVVTQGSGQVVIWDVSAEYVAGNIYLVRGRTQAGNTIRIAGRETLATRDGTFQLQIAVPPGTRELSIEAEDSQGYRGQYRFPLSGGRGTADAANRR